MAGASLDSLVACCPRITPETFCAMQPCVPVTLGPLHFTLSQPTSSAIVYALAAIYLAGAWHFRRVAQGQRTRAWWSLALVLAAVSAASAGTSYQAFGYELKCAGRAFCTWTSWWEVAYLTLQAAGTDAMLVAVAWACTGGRLRRGLFVWAGVHAATHAALTAVGAALAIKFLISFELLILFSAPNLVLVLGLCTARYIKHRSPMDRALLGAGLWLLLTTAAYYAYMTLGITQMLWARGIWFSDNDVLHLGMIAWAIYVPAALGKTAVDAPE